MPFWFLLVSPLPLMVLGPLLAAGIITWTVPWATAGSGEWWFLVGLLTVLLWHPFVFLAYALNRKVAGMSRSLGIMVSVVLLPVGGMLGSGMAFAGLTDAWVAIQPSREVLATVQRVDPIPQKRRRLPDYRIHYTYLPAGWGQDISAEVRTSRVLRPGDTLRIRHAIGAPGIHLELGCRGAMLDRGFWVFWALAWLGFWLWIMLMGTMAWWSDSPSQDASVVEDASHSTP